jgi:hypothetical protein
MATFFLETRKHALWRPPFSSGDGSTLLRSQSATSYAHAQRRSSQNLVPHKKRRSLLSSGYKNTPLRLQKQYQQSSGAIPSFCLSKTSLQADYRRRESSRIVVEDISNHRLIFSRSEFSTVGNPIASCSNPVYASVEGSWANIEGVSSCYLALELTRLESFKYKFGCTFVIG